MKKAINLKITNSELYKEDEMYMVTETTKDGDKVYNFTEILDSLMGQSGVGITISTTEEVPSQE